MTSFREDFSESFEAGRDLWHARIRRANREPLIVNGGAFPHSVACPHLKVGSAGTAAIGKARTRIDSFEPQALHSDTSGIQQASIA
jgi:hypothetical protein